jgi:hypothetical protein
MPITDCLSHGGASHVAHLPYTGVFASNFSVFLTTYGNHISLLGKNKTALDTKASHQISISYMGWNL